MSAQNFWSRRRAAVEAEEAQEARALKEAEAQARDAELAERSDADLLAELDLPDPDTLGPGDDFKAFLTEAVPARLKTRALRRLWVTNPVLANVDGLIDYGEDFTDAAMAVENIQTAYQVGKGMTAHVEELARQAEREAAAQGADDVAPDVAASDAQEDTISPEENAEAAAASVASAEAEEVQEDEIAHSDVQVEDTPPQVTSRRMRFVFEDAEATI
ncbi:DUF3306 domain-containing protein [Tritonibacter mobilis]|uniref:DUF3306 domain-containing protein n=1 Tax=Tritonibacter mobilis F1926 TaxID=1265309 RepID=A0A1B0ZYS4_9RHOB|nr:DUF3306 domain-containing protein [Tritonibacter mobilis]ANP39479.1 hypothetical protein K529_001760 [Tritonibacter mobilis F1926]KJZ23676.1 hypothetical protein TW79_12970 [Tritonibacter mobilis]